VFFLSIHVYILTLHEISLGDGALNSESHDEVDPAEFIISLLRKARKPLTTREVQESTEKALVRCPDSTVVFLNRLRLKGLIEGELSKEKRSWVWWIKIN